MMSRKATVWWSVAGVAVAAAVALGALMWFSGVWYSPGRKPVFPKDSGVIGGEDTGPIPPTWVEGDPSVAVVDVGSDWAWFFVDAEPYVKSIDIRVGESATLEGVTIVLCDTWYNKRAHSSGWWTRDWWTREVGAPLVNPSIAYYVTSYDGSTPTCP